MKKLLLTTLLLTCAVLSGFTQKKYTDFESGTPSNFIFGTSQTFSVVDNPLINDNNNSAKVARAQHGVENWAGFNLYVGGLINFSAGDSIFRIKVLSTNPSVNKVTLKIENNDVSATSKEVSVNYTTSGEWQELVFDFTSTGAISGTYGKLTLFLGNGSTNTADVWYIDDIKGTSFSTFPNVDAAFAMYDAANAFKEYKIKINGQQFNTVKTAIQDPVLGDSKYTYSTSFENYRIDSVAAGHDTVSFICDGNVLKTYIIENLTGKKIVKNYSYFGSLDDNGLANAYKVSSAPTIDGAVDNLWNSQPKHYLTKQTNNAGLANVGEIASYYKVTWDDTYFYTLNVISDKHKWVNNSNGAFNDDVEYYFDMLKNKGSYVADDYRYRYNWGGAENLKKGTPAGAMVAGDITKAESVILNGADTLGRIVEMRFPFAKLLSSFVVKDSASFNFDIKSVDNNSGTGRTDLIAWRDSVNDYTTVNSLGTVTLRKIKPEIILSNNEICLNNSVTVKDTVLGEATSWEWNFGDGASPATSTTNGAQNITYSTSGTKTITLTVNGAYVATKTITVKAIPEQFSLSVKNASFCDGLTDTLSLSASAVGLNYQLYKDNAVFGDVKVGDGLKLAWPVDTTGVYKVIATHTSGCTLDMLSPQTVTVNANPTMDLIVPQVFCDPAGATISVLGSQESVKYSIFKNNVVSSLKIGNGDTLQFAGLFDGTYRIVAKDTITLCSSVSADTLIKQDNLPAMFSISATQTSYCKGNSTLVAVSGSEVGTNYKLKLNGAEVGTALEGTGNALNLNANSGSGNYRVIAYKSASCVLTLDSAVAITELATPTIGAISIPSSYCAGLSVTATLAATENQVTYQLYKDGAVSGAATDGNGASLAWNDLNKGAYKIKAVSKVNSCESIAAETSVTENAKPVLSVLTGADAYCAGSSSSLTLALAQAGFDYQLKLNGTVKGAAIAGAGSNIEWNGLTAGSYKVIAANATTGCSDSTAVKAIAENSLPTIAALTGDASYCAGSNVALAVSSSVTGVNYQLVKDGVNNGAVVAGNGSTLTWNNLTKGQYKVMATNASTACAAFSDAKAVAEIAMPTKPVITVADKVLTSSASAGNKWYLASNVIENATAKTYTSTQSGSYKVEVTVNGCSAMSDAVSVVITAIKESSVASFSILPNPNNGNFRLKLENNTEKPLEVMVFDAAGKLVYKSNTMNMSGNTSEQISIGNVLPGSYFVRVNSENKVSTKGLVVK